MTLADSLKLPRLTNVAKNDPRYQSTRIADQPVRQSVIDNLLQKTAPP